MATNWVRIAFDDENIASCMEYGQLMRDGNVQLGNVRYGDIDNVENYTDCKISELAFWKWLTANKVTIRHHPFRDDYSVLNPDDDFIIILAGELVRIEVKHKTRNVPPKGDYGHCSETIRPDRLYVFTERQRPNKDQRPKRGEALQVEHCRGSVNLIGWITPARFLENARLVPEGTVMQNPRGGQNFTTHRDEYNVEVRHLSDMATLIP